MGPIKFRRGKQDAGDKHRYGRVEVEQGLVFVGELRIAEIEDGY